MTQEAPNRTPVEPDNEAPFEQTEIEATLAAARMAKCSGLSPAVVQLILSTQYTIPLHTELD